MIIVLSNKIQELTNETEPLRKKKKELEDTVKNAYNELIHEFNNNKKEDQKVQDYENMIRVLRESITTNTKLFQSIQFRMMTILKELQRISQTDAHEISGVAKKVHCILENLTVIIESKTHKDIDNKPLKFPKPVTPPWKTTKNKNDINMYTQEEL